MANDVSEPGVGFEHDTNAVVLLGADGAEQQVALTAKRDVARVVIDAVSARLSPDPGSSRNDSTERG